MGEIETFISDSYCAPIRLVVASYGHTVQKLSALDSAQRDLGPEAFSKRDDKPKVASWKSLHQSEWISTSTYVDRGDKIGKKKKNINVTLDWGQFQGELHIQALSFNKAGFLGNRDLSQHSI